MSTTKKYYGIYHRPTDSWAKYTPLSLYSFRYEGFPKLLDKSSSAKRVITNFITYCKWCRPHELEFSLGLEVVEIIPTFKSGDVVFRQIFNAEKLNSDKK